MAVDPNLGAPNIASIGAADFRPQLERRLVTCEASLGRVSGSISPSVTKKFWGLASPAAYRIYRFLNTLEECPEGQ